MATRGTLRPTTPLLYVEDGDAAVRAAVSDRLIAAGMRVYTPETVGSEDDDTKLVGSFRCALLHLGRLNGKADAVDSAELLRVYQPTLPVGFLFDEASTRLLDRARALGPVFHTPDGLDSALDWALAHATG
jgi:hypothetical protein